MDTPIASHAGAEHAGPAHPGADHPRHHAHPAPHRKRWVRVTAAAAAVILVPAAVILWNYSSSHESTDDAVIEAHVLPISSKVAGQVQKVYVTDNQEVKQGDPLVDLDDRDYQVRLEQARAELAATEAEAKRASGDAKRYEQLFGRDQVSKQAYEKAVADADVLKARTVLAQKKADAAELDLSYAKITAPAAGKIARKSIEMRSFVQVGQPLMAVVPEQVWVIANFKETQLERMSPGQPVKIHVDTYPDHVFRGHVDSIQSGTGARFSLLPPENATGNFVKVVQRVPVKIVFDEPTAGYLLVPGMSVVPVIAIQ